MCVRDSGETDFYNGKYGDPNSPEARRKLDRVQEGIRMDANDRHRTEAEEAEQGSVTNAGKELSKAVESLNQIKDRLAAVSYTHLDVYKRQETTSNRKFDPDSIRKCGVWDEDGAAVYHAGNAVYLRCV